MTPAGPTFVVTLEPLPDEVPAAVRLKRLLKFAQRCLKFRCVFAQEVPAVQGEAKEGERRK
jgi:hypothetical protein